jgi:hypothetical protein
MFIFSLFSLFACKDNTFLSKTRRKTQKSDEESCQEDDRRAEYDGQIGVQVDAWQISHGSQRYPRNNHDACDATQEGCQAVDFLRDTAQQEEAEHASAEYRAERPPSVDDAFYREHRNSHTGP